MEKLEQEDRTSEQYLKFRYLHRLSYPSVSGAIGAQSVLFAKCSVELAINWFQGHDIMFDHYQTYIVLLCMLLTICLQIKWLNDGLKRFDASYTVPVFTAFWIVLSVTSGLVFYDEYQGMTWSQLGMFFFGVFISITGVYILSHRGIDHYNQQQYASFPETEKLVRGAQDGLGLSDDEQIGEHTASGTASNAGTSSSSTLGIAIAVDQDNTLDHVDNDT